MSATRRTSLTNRRRSSGSTTKLLGAVKLQSPLAGSDAGSPCSSASDASALTTPQNRSPLVVGRGAVTVPAAAPAAADALAQFSQHLTSSRSSDKWLDDWLSPSDAKEHPRRQQAAPAAAPQGQAVEPPTSQIVHKALRFITGDLTPPPPEGAQPRPKPTSFDSQSFLDKGMDAISGVGKLMEGFAITLDSVIGQAFEDWGASPSAPALSSSSAARGAKPAARRPAASSSSGGLAAPRAAAQATAAPAPQEERRGGGGAGNKENAPAAQAPVPTSSKAGAAGRQPHITSFMSKLDAASEQEVQEWRKRAQQLAGELQRVRAQQEEYQRLRLQCDKLQADLRRTASAADQLAEENSALKSRSLPPGADPALADPLAAQQVALQLEALLAEKSKLVQENDRLLRENTGLQELLEFTLVHQAQLAGDDELFGEEEAPVGDAPAGGAAQQASGGSGEASAAAVGCGGA